MSKRENKIYKVTILGSIVNVFLLIFKFIAGIIGHSSAMVADAFHSLSDFFSDLVVIFMVRLAGKPEDEAHAYGHGKYETLASLIIGVMLLGVGLGIAYDGIEKVINFFKGARLEEPNFWALSAAVISIISKEALYHYTKREGDKLDSSALVANAWHHRSDSFTSIAALIGIGGAMLLGSHWAVLDPIAATVVSVFIVGSSVSLMRPALDELLERSLPEDELKEIDKIIKEDKEIVSYHHLRTRKVGHIRAIEMHIKLDSDITLHQAHDIATRLENKIKHRFGSETHVGIHMEPI